MDLSSVEVVIIAVIASIGLAAAIFGLLSVRSYWIAERHDRRRIEREEIEDEYKAHLKQCGFTPDECEECHLPGDCPLCGAE